jgi:hypothetical protein
MTDEVISPLRRRMIEDMTIRKLVPKTQQGYIRNVKAFAQIASYSIASSARASSVAGTSKAERLWLSHSSARGRVGGNAVATPRRFPVG